LPVGPKQTLLHYRLTEKLGEGGMGAVWRAVDTSLDREVAIKVLPESGLASRDQMLARFEREAKLLASLNHSNIAAVYGLHEADGSHFIAMELVAGEDLARRIRRGALPIDDALQISVQVAEALAVAHDRGVIHRDLKPANVMLTPEGAVKVLDFGLAKALAGEGEPESGEPSISMSPTMTRAATQAGLILGTAAYMSPEQARGKPVDRRADIWALGCLVYEMLTGRTAFRGETVTDTLAAVVRAEPDWDALPQTTPRSIRRVLQRMLRKDPTQRLRDAGDARLELDDALQRGSDDDGPGSFGRQPRSNRRTALIATGAILAGIVIGVLSMWALVSPQREAKHRPVVRTRLAWAGGPLAEREEEGLQFASLAPDGRSIVFGDQNRLWVRRLDELEPEPLPGTDGGFGAFFSPDSQSVAFFNGPELRRVPLAGGLPRVICEIPDGMRGLTGTWGTGDVIVFGISGPTGLWRVSANGGRAEPITRLEPSEADHDWPQILPDGEAVLFTIAPAPTYAWNDATIVVQSLSTGDRKLLVEGGSYARYVSSGHLLYASEGGLMAVPFDADKLEVTGPPSAVAEQVDQSTYYSGVAQYSVSEKGDLLFVRGDHLIPRTTAAWMDREGNATPALPPGRYGHASISPDGTRMAVILKEEGLGDLYVYDLATGIPNRLTFERRGGSSPVWTRDGKTLFYFADDVVYSRAADGTGTAKPVLDGRFFPTSVSADGELLLGVVGSVLSNSLRVDTGADIAVLEIGSGEPPRPLIVSGSQNTSPVFSPDGKWIAYQSDESGKNQIYVQPFPDVDGGRWQVSPTSGSGLEPVWGSRGGEIFYRDDLAQMVVPMMSETPFVVGSPTRLFESSDVSGWISQTLVAPGGERFLVFENWDDPDKPTELILVQNWLQELERLAPAK
jgi:serine/threonine protein kinase/Tol biopolymer transport system component